jgi:Ca2+/Na+ antiporter
MMPAVHHLSQLLVWTQDAQILTAQARAKELLVDNGWIFGGFFLVVAALVAVLYTTRTGVIARAAAKEAIRQPVFPLLLTISLVMMVFNTFIPFFSLGEDVKMMEVCGLAMLLICGMFLAIWTSSMSIADEIEGKTAMTKQRCC